MAGVAIRISQQTHRMLLRLARQEGQPLGVVLRRAVEVYRDQRFWRHANQAFAALRQSRKAWRAETAEREVWDVALPDGLETTHE